jgi:hypothetical protein
MSQDTDNAHETGCFNSPNPATTEGHRRHPPEGCLGDPTWSETRFPFYRDVSAFQAAAKPWREGANHARAHQNTGRAAQKSPKPRTGSIQRGIRRAFIAEPQRAWSTSAVAEWTHCLPIYSGKTSEREWHNHRRAIRRACERLCVRVGRSKTGSGRAILWRLRAEELRQRPLKPLWN